MNIVSPAFDPAHHLTKVNGRDYLTVKWRLVWLRQRDPDAKVETELMTHPADQSQVVFKATVTMTSGAMATGWASQEQADHAEWFEKCETKAVGRALAALGFGTEFTEYDDFEVVADSPVQLQQTEPASIEQMSQIPEEDKPEVHVWESDKDRTVTEMFGIPEVVAWSQVRARFRLVVHKGQRPQGQQVFDPWPHPELPVPDPADQLREANAQREGEMAAQPKPRRQTKAEAAESMRQQQQTSRRREGDDSQPITAEQKAWILQNVKETGLSTNAMYNLLKETAGEQPRGRESWPNRLTEALDLLSIAEGQKVGAMMMTAIERKQAQAARAKDRVIESHVADDLTLDEEMN